MTPREIVLFASIGGLQAALCFFVYSRQVQKRFPLFAAYATTMLASSLIVGVVFVHFGFRTLISYYASWLVVALITLTRSAAIVELCRESLSQYPGIWALTWRLLSVITAIFFFHAAIDSSGLPNWITAYTLTIERDLEITSVFILIAMLLISNYYELRIAPFQKWMAIGICLFCVIEFMNNTILRDFLVQYMKAWTVLKYRVEAANTTWNTIHALAADSSLGVLCFAFRKPLPESAKAPALLSEEIYRELSPAINLRLRAFNARLVELLKP